MSDTYFVSVDDEKPEVLYDFLDAIATFTRAVRDDAGSVTLKWSA